MACPEFEDLLRDGAASHGAGGPGADGHAADHAAHCEECRALLDAAADVDATLEAAFAGIPAPSGMVAAVRARVAREIPMRGPSLVPELLDFIGWAAVLAVAAILLPRVLPLVDAALARLN